MEKELPAYIIFNKGETTEEVVEVPFSYIEGTSSEKIKLDTKAELGLRLFVSGTCKMKEAAILANTKPAKIKALMETDQGKDTIQRIRLELDMEFQALYRDSIQALREGLASGDLKLKVDTADKFLKYAKEMKINLVLSAEDLVRAIRDGKVNE